MTKRHTYRMFVSRKAFHYITAAMKAHSDEEFVLATLVQTLRRACRDVALEGYNETVVAAVWEELQDPAEKQVFLNVSEDWHEEYQQALRSASMILSRNLTASQFVPLVLTHCLVTSEDRAKNQLTM